jgi:thymidylate synthase (FAD)
MEVKLIQASSMEGIYAGYRECHASQDKSDQGGEKDQALVKRLLFGCSPVHDSPIEHCLYTWRIDGVSRSLSHQLVRHRIASFSQRSQRYVSERQFEYVTPPSIKNNVTKVTETVFNPLGCTEGIFMSAMIHAQEHYNKLVAAGVPKEDARFVLPNACTTSLVVSMNPRAFRNFLKLRLDTHAQWEIRSLAWAMLRSIPAEHEFMYQDFLETTECTKTKD